MKSNYRWLTAILVAVVTVYIIDLNVSAGRIGRQVPVLKYSLAGIAAILLILAVQARLNKRRTKNKADDHNNQG